MSFFFLGGGAMVKSFSRIFMHKIMYKKIKLLYNNEIILKWDKASKFISEMD